MTTALEIPGRLVTLPLRGRRRPLDGFWCRGRRPARHLLVFVHGMQSNFYRSQLKKDFMLAGARENVDVLSFNNRGAEEQTATERFRDTLGDLDAALAFARRHGYRRVALAGHSTGCQKITYYQAVRRDPAVRALVLLAIGDDLAIMRRDLGRRFSRWVRAARRMTARGRGDEMMPPGGPPYSARRFLSIADPQEIEARLFDFGGDLSHFRRIRCPVLAVFAGADEYNVLPAKRTAALLAAATRSARFAARIVRGADHGFHGCERRVAQAVYTFLEAAM